MEWIVEELELENGFGRQPTAVQLLDAVNHTERIDFDGIAGTVGGNFARLQMSFPATNVKVIRVRILRVDEVSILDRSLVRHADRDRPQVRVCERREKRKRIFF